MGSMEYSLDLLITQTVTSEARTKIVKLMFYIPIYYEPNAMEIIILVQNHHDISLSMK